MMNVYRLNSLDLVDVSLGLFFDAHDSCAAVSQKPLKFFLRSFKRVTIHELIPRLIDSEKFDELSTSSNGRKLLKLRVFAQINQH